MNAREHLKDALKTGFTLALRQLLAQVAADLLHHALNKETVDPVECATHATCAANILTAPADELANPMAQAWLDKMADDHAALVEAHAARELVGTGGDLPDAGEHAGLELAPVPVDSRPDPETTD